MNIVGDFGDIRSAHGPMPNTTIMTNLVQTDFSLTLTYCGQLDTTHSP